MQVLGPEQGLGADYIAGLRLGQDDCLVLNAAGVLRPPHSPRLELAATDVEAVINLGEPEVTLKRFQARAVVGAANVHLQEVRRASSTDKRLVRAINSATGTSELVDRYVHHFEKQGMTEIDAGLAVLRGMERIMRRPDLITMNRSN